MEREFNQDLLFYFRDGLPRKAVSHSSRSTGNYVTKSDGILSLYGSNKTISLRTKDKLVFFSSGEFVVTSRNINSARGVLILCGGEQSPLRILKGMIRIFCGTLWSYFSHSLANLFIFRGRHGFRVFMLI